MRTCLGSIAGLILVFSAACGEVKPTFVDATPTTIDAAVTIDGSVPIDGPAGQALLEIDRTTADVGTVLVNQVSATATLTITNTGTATSGTVNGSITGAGWATTANGCNNMTLAPSISCQIRVAVTPTAPGLTTGTLTVTAGPGGTVTAMITATALAPGALTVTPMTHDFLNVVAGGMTATIPITARNTGGSTTGNLSVALGGSDAGEFRIVNDGCTNQQLLTNGMCVVNVRLQPAVGSSGSKAASVTIIASPGGAGVTTLMGTVDRPAVIALTGSGAFGDDLIGMPVTQTIVVTNTGQQLTGALSVTRSGSAAFSILTGLGTDCASGSTTLGPSPAFCNVRVQFNPGAPGVVSGMLTVSASPGGTQNVALSGNGQRPPTLMQNTNTGTFGQVEVTTLSTTMQTWTITNTGDVASSAPILTLSAEVEQTGSTCAAAIGAGGMCTMTLRFRPSGGGARTGTATLAVTGSSVTLNATAMGMWRVTVNRTGTAGAVTSTPAGLSCVPPATTCSALFVPSTITVEARTNNGSGAYFAAWSGMSAGPCADGPNRDCVLTVDSAETLNATFNTITANLAFVSSATHPTNLGGTAPYDTSCNTLATAAGINNGANNNFVAWISDTNSNVLSRMGVAAAASGWVRMDGRVFAASRASLLAGGILNPVRYTELGTDPGDQSPITGTSEAGATVAAQTCSNWTVNSGSIGVLLGNSMAGPGSWTDGTGTTCTAQTYRLICMMRQFTTGTTPTTFAGKRVWASNASYTVSTTNSPDTVCTNDRPAGVASGRALIARTTSAPSSLVVAAQMYVRPDGQEVGTGAELTAGLNRAGIWQLGNGNYMTTITNVWTGSLAFNQVGTAASTCGDWIDPNQGGRYGFGERSRNIFWSFATFASCTFPVGGPASPRIYCYEP